jgi:transglutaminase-like putative cysteine protease
VIYRVRHRTAYAYDDQVGFARCVLRLTPRSSPGQTVLDSSVSINPAPSQRRVGTGPFGEQTLTIIVEKPHRALVIDARSRVEVSPLPIAEEASSPCWETIRTRSFETADLGPESPASFLYATARTPISAEITDYARASFTHGRPIADAVTDLMIRLRSDFVYEPGATDVFTPTRKAFAARQGVCQDFAHIMISGLRGLGLPAAYVSGYIRTTPPPGRRRLEGADATHAWVSAWCGEDQGWIGFDPTNGVMAREDHIILAVGRDYADVAPIDGVVLGSGEQALKVEVDVVPEDDSGAWKFTPRGGVYPIAAHQK